MVNRGPYKKLLFSPRAHFPPEVRVCRQLSNLLVSMIMASGDPVENGGGSVGARIRISLSRCRQFRSREY